LEIGKLMGSQKAPKLDFFIAIKDCAEDLDVDRVLTFLPIMIAAHSGMGAAQKRIYQDQSQQSYGKR
jgi:hypothetical protein